MRDEVAAQKAAKPPSANKDKVLIRDLNFYYGQTHALKGVNLNLLQGSGDGVHRPFGLRQVDASAGFEPHV